MQYAQGPQGSPNNTVKSTVKYLAKILSPQRGPVLDLDPENDRHTNYLKNNEFEVIWTPNIKSIDDTERTYAAIICSYILEQMGPHEQQEYIDFIKSHVIPTGYLAISALLGTCQGIKKVVQSEFEKWSRVRESEGSTISMRMGGVYPCLDVLLQKPEE